jgi:hypothetical protein
MHRPVTAEHNSEPVAGAARIPLHYRSNKAPSDERSALAHPSITRRTHWFSGDQPMKLTFRELAGRQQKVVMVVHSLDQALYQVTFTLDEREYLLSENNGKVFRRHSLSEVREALQVLPVESISLRQTSAYDEMIGQPARERDNTLEVPLSMDLYPPITRH